MAYREIAIKPGQKCYIKTLYYNQDHSYNRYGNYSKNKEIFGQLSLPQIKLLL